MTAALAAGQAVAQPASDALERDRIGADRARAQAAFSAELAACYQRFAVTSCVEDVRRRRRDTLADLRRQETVLNEQQRKRDTAQQMQRFESRQAERHDDASRREAAAVAGQADRGERAARKGLERQANEQNAKARARVTHHPAATPADSADSRGPRAATPSADPSARERAAEERRRKREAQTERRAKAPARPLPIPP